MKFKIYFLNIILLTLLSCNKEEEPICPAVVQEPSVELLVHPYFGSSPLFLDSTYLTSENYKIKFQEIKFYWTNVENAGKVLTTAALFDFREKGKSFCTASGISDDFLNLNGLLGVDSVRNTSDPNLFGNDSPLNSLNFGGMHWGWNPGYIFVKVEAKLDTIPDNVELYDHFVSFHIGKHENLKTFQFNNIPWQKVDDFKSVANLKLDMKIFFESPSPINILNENVSHTANGQELISDKVITNFLAALTFF